MKSSSSGIRLLLTAMLVVTLIAGCSKVDEPGKTDILFTTQTPSEAGAPGLIPLDGTTVSGVIYLHGDSVEGCRSVEFHLGTGDGASGPLPPAATNADFAVLDTSSLDDGWHQALLVTADCSNVVDAAGRGPRAVVRRFRVRNGGQPPSPRPEPAPTPTPTPEQPREEPELVGDWYVATVGSNQNDGRSKESPFASITRAAKAARPGDVIVVADGIYREAVVTSATGTPDSRIVFRSESPHGAKIDATGNYTAWSNSGDYVDIVGFDVTGADYLGVVNWGSYVRIIGNEVHHLAAPSCNRPNGGAGIDHANFQARGNSTIGNIVHDITTRDLPCPLIHGIYHANEGGVIQNNIVYNVAYAGIHMWHEGNAVTISNNLVWNSVVGILVGGALVEANGYVITNNILLKNNVGIQEMGRNFGAGNVYSNNLTSSNGTDYIMVKGVPRGMIRAEPKMVDFQADGSGDYRLAQGSPAIDSGTVQGAPETDFDGIARPQQSAVDIGPFEFTPTIAAAAAHR